jgi:hypothetical protein
MQSPSGNHIRSEPRRDADRLSVSVGCLRAWRIRGEGPSAIRIDSALRCDEREVDAWLNACRESGRFSLLTAEPVRGWKGPCGTGVMLG